MSRCEKHDLEIISCADCRPRPGYAQATAGRQEVSRTGFRELREIELVEWGPDLVGYAEQARLAAEEAPDG